MSGHNRWSKLKRFKVVEGARKGKLYSKLLKEITVAAKLGGGEPSNNARLRVALAAARGENVPGDTIGRAVKKGTGELEGVSYDEVLYEGYGPGGVALLVECLTDNSNRSANDVRSALMHHGGSFGSPGSVKFLFTKTGVVEVKPGPTEERVMELGLEAGADDVLVVGDEGFEVRCEPAALHVVGSALEQAGLALGAQRWTWLPSTWVPVAGEAASAVLALVEQLEDFDDVQNVYGNFELAE